MEELGCDVRLFTSDRSKALIKLALEEFGCDSGADLFHAMQDLSRWGNRRFPLPELVEGRGKRRLSNRFDMLSEQFGGFTNSL